MAVQSRNSAAYKTDLTRTQAKDLRTKIKDTKVAMIGCGKLGQDCAEVMAQQYMVEGYDVEPRKPENLHVLRFFYFDKIALKSIKNPCFDLRDLEKTISHDIFIQIGSGIIFGVGFRPILSNF